MKELLKELGFEYLPALSKFVSALTLEKHNPYMRSKALGTIKTIDDYNKYISQPITKGMFVPCDEEGEVLVEVDCGCDAGTGIPGMNDKECICRPQCHDYQQAQERVLFFGKDIPYEDGEYYFGETGSFETVGWIDEDGEVWFNTEDYYGKAQYGTIESAINDGIKLKLK